MFVQFLLNSLRVSGDIGGPLRAALERTQEVLVQLENWKPDLRKKSADSQTGGEQLTNKG